MRAKYAGAGDCKRAGVRLHGGSARAYGAQRATPVVIMNDTEPSASDIAAFERDLKSTRYA